MARFIIIFVALSSVRTYAGLSASSQASSLCTQIAMPALREAHEAFKAKEMSAKRYNYSRNIVWESCLIENTYKVVLSKPEKYCSASLKLSLIKCLRKNWYKPKGAQAALQIQVSIVDYYSKLHRSNSRNLASNLPNSQREKLLYQGLMKDLVATSKQLSISNSYALKYQDREVMMLEKEGYQNFIGFMDRTINKATIALQQLSQHVTFSHDPSHFLKKWEKERARLLKQIQN